jgi:hypothetical protein
LNKSSTHLYTLRLENSLPQPLSHQWLLCQAALLALNLLLLLEALACVHHRF